MSRRQQEKERLNQYPCPEEDELRTPGVLLSNEIKHYATKYQMIDPFNVDNLKPAAYELTVGQEYSKGGVSGTLIDDPAHNTIDIQPFESVVITTAETLNLPRFIVGRWNIRVRKAYDGLLWVGGPQVDPGWVGKLACPIYNLSSKPVKIKLGEAIAVIDFVKTTPFQKSVSVSYARPPTRVIFDDYNADELRSALFAQAKERIDKLEEDTQNRVSEVESRTNKVEAKLNTSIGIIFTAIAILVAAVSIFVTSAQGEGTTPSQWVYLVFGLSIAALVLAILAFTQSRFGKVCRAIVRSCTGCRRKSKPNAQSD